MEQIKVRDERRKGYYTIDNELIDLPISALAVAAYNWLARYSGKEESAFISVSGASKKWKVGRPKIRAAIAELETLKTIRRAGKSESGCEIYVLLDKSGWAIQPTPMVQLDQPPGHTAHPPGLSRPTNNPEGSILMNTEKQSPVSSSVADAPSSSTGNDPETPVAGSLPADHDPGKPERDETDLQKVMGKFSHYYKCRHQKAPDLKVRTMAGGIAKKLLAQHGVTGVLNMLERYYYVCEYPLNGERYYAEHEFSMKSINGDSWPKWKPEEPFGIDEEEQRETAWRAQEIRAGRNVE